ncbi:MAG: hypothetical protein A3J46_02305 [Candidatus Yanofskybacteria bacterium RIFCSPHIGHO2_02_FULL_41_11]|uniref:Uncharacterized protein n=1 Tax=Candidatus Yanofskybacteria bacterium RIFCSPHIGHO2_02_FULL_41_11 TaxID=1802675 RepID=A0A1F8FBE7_9BACT|nr:MAG: hypothetical protein A3J46_02305 [Candidatus Yanofskybacteria bacterium RIFCSPHIGHO2_02_FULL_41_11]
MNKELLETGADMQKTPEENNYQKYLALGGIINEADYNSALERIRSFHLLTKTLILQAENIAKYAEIELQNVEDGPDPRVILYGILRSDIRPEGVEYHHSSMSDQKLFVEALRMLGDAESVGKMIKRYPNISFKYQRGPDK